MTQWIRVESALIRHPKVLLLAARLKKNCYEVVGRLVVEVLRMIRWVTE